MPIPAIAALLGAAGTAAVKSKMDQKEEAVDAAEVAAAMPEARKVENLPDRESMQLAAENRRKTQIREQVAMELKGLLQKFKAEDELDQKVEEKKMKERK